MEQKRKMFTMGSLGITNGQLERKDANPRCY